VNARVDAVFERAELNLSRFSLGVLEAFADAKDWLRGTAQTLLSEADRHPELTEEERIQAAGDILADQFYKARQPSEGAR
jgi:hypothetical protein